MSNENKQVIYDDDNIKTLDSISAIRLRPAMYVDGIGEPGLYKIDCEAVQNIFDEYLVGRCTSCKVKYDSSTGYMKVEDDGAGIPVGKIVDIFTKAHTGGKFDREAYEISSGQNGVIGSVGIIGPVRTGQMIVHVRSADHKHGGRYYFVFHPGIDQDHLAVFDGSEFVEI